MIDPARRWRLVPGSAVSRLDVAGFMAAAWRRRRLALATMATVCLVGWSVLAAVPPGDGGPTGAGMEASIDRPAVAAEPGSSAATALDGERAKLRADLAASRALHLETLNDLVATPATLGDGGAVRPNPIHQRLRVLHERQQQLMLALERRLAALEPPEPGRARGGSGRSGRERSEGSTAAGRWALAGAVPLAGLALGWAVAGWRGRRDEVVDGIAQLRSVTSIPVLAAIGRAGRGRWSWGRRVGAGGP